MQVKHIFYMLHIGKVDMVIFSTLKHIQREKLMFTTHESDTLIKKAGNICVIENSGRSNGHHMPTGHILTEPQEDHGRSMVMVMSLWTGRIFLLLLHILIHGLPLIFGFGKVNCSLKSSIPTGHSP